MATAQDIAKLHEGYLRIRDRMGITWTEYYCILTLDKQLRGYVDKDAYLRGADSQASFVVSEILDWDGKGKTQSYSFGFKIKTDKGAERECLADNLREQIQWMKFLKAVTDPESAAGQLLKRMKHKEERLQREEKKKEKIMKKRLKEKNERDKINAERDKEAFAQYIPEGATEAVKEVVDPLRRRPMAMRNMRTARNKLHKEKKKAEKDGLEKEKQEEEEEEEDRDALALVPAPPRELTVANVERKENKEERAKAKGKKKKEKKEKEKLLAITAGPAPPAVPPKIVKKVRFADEVEDSDEYEDLFGAPPIANGTGGKTDDKKKKKGGRSKSKKKGAAEEDEFEDLFGSAGGEEEKDKPVAVKDDPRFVHYFKLLSIGLPKAAVQRKMALEGSDPSVLDLDPNQPYPTS